MVLPPSKRRKATQNSLDSMSKLFFNPSECNKLHPPPFARGGKKVDLISTRRALATLSTVWRLTMLASFLFYTNTKCIKSIYPIVPTAILKRVFFFQI